MVYLRILSDWPSAANPLILAGSVERFDERRAKLLVADGKAEYVSKTKPVATAPPVDKQVKDARKKWA